MDETQLVGRFDRLDQWFFWFITRFFYFTFFKISQKMIFLIQPTIFWQTWRTDPFQFSWKPVFDGFLIHDAYNIIHLLSPNGLVHPTVKQTPLSRWKFTSASTLIAILFSIWLIHQLECYSLFDVLWQTSVARQGNGFTSVQKIQSVGGHRIN
jgi:hypothetical protein